MAVRLVTDSSCDLPASLAAECGIEIVPLTIRFGADELVDRRDLTPAEFWARCARETELPQTAAPSPGAFEEAFRKLQAEGADGVVCVNLSADLSATIQAAQAAATIVGAQMPVEVVDSRSVSLGLGLIAVEAARRGAAGASVEEVAALARDLAGRTRIHATVDTLDHLKKGGRIGGAQALLGSLLSIKPVIEVRDGKVEAGPKQRTRARALRYLVDQVAAAGTIERLAVVHAEAPDRTELLDQLATHFPRDQIVVGDLGPVVGTHTGPRTIGVIFQVRSA
jgi:DegV family protein with EDD domain